MQDLMIEIMGLYGYIGIAVLIAVENVFPPIPSEVILTFGGFMTTYTTLNVWLVIAAATVGSVIGAVILYGVGYMVNQEKLAQLFAGKVGRILHLKPEDICQSQKWFNSSGNLTVFFCRFIPIIRSLISIPAGMAKMKIGSFLWMTIAGTTIWNIVLVWLGVLAGESWEKIVVYMGTYAQVGKFIIGAGMIVGLLIFFTKRRLKQKQNG